MEQQTSTTKKRSPALIEAQKRYYLKHKEKILAKQKAYDDQHREDINKKHRERKYHLKAKVELN